MNELPAQIGRYEVQSVIGRGAMGVIYRAHDPAIDRLVALKLVRADLLSGDEREDYLKRFRQEAQAAGRCMHPNIVAIYDFALHEGNPFLAMEYVQGISLAEALARGTRFRIAEAVYIVRQMLDALACAHALGVVHRDVKPANVLLLASGHVKVTDFGISRIETSHLTQTGSVVGTPSYMSPEQCRAGQVDARSDVFSAGAVLYELLSGERPFSGRTFSQVMHQVMNEDPADIREKVPGLPSPVYAALRRALEKRPEDRFPSAQAMADVLRSNGAAVTADDRTVVAQAGDPAHFAEFGKNRAGAGRRPARSGPSRQHRAAACPTCWTDRQTPRPDGQPQDADRRSTLRGPVAQHRGAGRTRGLSRRRYGARALANRLGHDTHHGRLR